MTFLVRIPRVERHGSALTTIEGPTFFLARAEAARKYKVDPAEIKPAIRFTMGKGPSL